MTYTPEIKHSIITLSRAGYPSRAIAEILQIGKSGVNNYLAEVNGNGGPKVLFFDLETAPAIAVAFGRYNINLTQDHILQSGNWMISASWSWLGQDKIHSSVVTPTSARAANDIRVVDDLLQVYNKADIVVAHNALKFDVPIFKTRLMLNGFAPARSVRVIDTLRMAKKLKFESNKLDNISQEFGIGEKFKHEGIKLWIACMQGDSDALKRMVEYNKQDVKLLKEVYAEMAPFDPSTPNFATYYDDDLLRCTTCGSTHLVPTVNKVHSNLARYQELVCNHCGTRSRTRVNELTKEKRKSLVTGV